MTRPDRREARTDGGDVARRTAAPLAAAGLAALALGVASSHAAEPVDAQAGTAGPGTAGPGTAGPGADECVPHVDPGPGPVSVETCGSARLELRTPGSHVFVDSRGTGNRVRVRIGTAGDAATPDTDH